MLDLKRTPNLVHPELMYSEPANATLGLESVFGFRPSSSASSAVATSAAKLHVTVLADPDGWPLLDGARNNGECRAPVHT